MLIENHFRYGDQVSIGDEVLLNVNSEITPAEVTNVSNFVMKGKYLS